MKLFTFDILNARVIFECVGNGEKLKLNRIMQKMILFRNVKFEKKLREKILEKKPLKILHNSVLLEMFLLFSIRLIF